MRFERVETEGQRAEALGAFFALHGQRWEGRGGSTAFYSASLREFHEAWTRVALGRGWLRFFLMRLDGRPVGAIYGFRYRGTFGFYQTGFDPAYARHGIGQVMIGLSIKSAIEEGADEYDLLHGTERYKSDWARSMRELSRIEAYPPSLRGRVHGRLARWTGGPGAWRAARWSGSRGGSHDRRPGAPRAQRRQDRARPGASWSGADALIGSLADTGASSVVIGYHRVVEDFSSAARFSIPAMLTRAGCWRHSSTGSAGDTASSRSTSSGRELEPGRRARTPARRRDVRRRLSRCLRRGAARPHAQGHSGGGVRGHRPGRHGPGAGARPALHAAVPSHRALADPGRRSRELLLDLDLSLPAARPGPAGR